MIYNTWLNRFRLWLLSPKCTLHKVANTFGHILLLPIYLKYWSYKKSFRGNLSFYICMTVHFWEPSARQFISFDILSSTASELPKIMKKTYQNVVLFFCRKNRSLNYYPCVTRFFFAFIESWKLCFTYGNKKLLCSEYLPLI